MHVRAALRNGLTGREIREVLLQVGVYAGVPAANRAFAVAQRVLAEESRRIERPADRGRGAVRRAGEVPGRPLPVGRAHRQCGRGDEGARTDRDDDGGPAAGGAGTARPRPSVVPSPRSRCSRAARRGTSSRTPAIPTFPGPGAAPATSAPAPRSTLVPTDCNQIPLEGRPAEPARAPVGFRRRPLVARRSRPVGRPSRAGDLHLHLDRGRGRPEPGLDRSSR